MNAGDCAFETPWVLYAHFPCGSVNYGASYMKLGRIETVEDLWCLLNNVPSILYLHDNRVTSKGSKVVAYSIFRDGVRPEWEDPVNAVGSDWGCRETLDRDKFAKLWLDYLLGAVGENIPHCVGVRAINKSNRTRALHKIEIWMDSTEHASVQACRRSLTELVPSSPRFVHMPHQEKKVQAHEYQKRRRRY